MAGVSPSFHLPLWVSCLQPVHAWREPSGRSRHCSHGDMSLFFSYLPSHAQLALSPKLEYSLHSCLVKLVEYILTLLIIYTSERLIGVCLLSPLDKNEEVNRREIKPLDWIFKDFIIARGSMLGTGGLRRHSISSGMSFHVTLAHTYFFFIAWLMLRVYCSPLGLNCIICTTVYLFLIKLFLHVGLQIIITSMKTVRESYSLILKGPCAVLDTWVSFIHDILLCTMPYARGWEHDGKWYKEPYILVETN